MRVLITGATGNIGTSLVQRLSDDPDIDEIIGVSRGGSGPALPKVTWVRADVTSSDLVPIFDGADAVVHLAWTIQPSHRFDELHQINVGGTKRVFDAATLAGVPTLVHMSSVGAYSPGPKDRFVDESYETYGIASSQYSRDKAMAERMFELLVLSNPNMRCVTARPALVLKETAGAHVRRTFAGRLLPLGLLSGRRLPVVPELPNLRFQAVHSDDVAVALQQMIKRDVTGAFNLAAEPVLDPAAIAEALGGMTLKVPGGVARLAVDLSWKARLQPTDPGWLDITTQVPLMSSVRAHELLGWQPTRSATTALQDVFKGATDNIGYPTPTLKSS